MPLEVLHKHYDTPEHKKNVETVSKLQYYCHMCKCVYKGLTSFEDHKAGRKHRCAVWKQETAESAVKVSILPDSREAHHECPKLPILLGNDLMLRYEDVEDVKIGFRCTILKRCVQIWQGVQKVAFRSN